MADGDSGGTLTPAGVPGRRELEQRAGLWPIGRALTVATVAAVVGLAAVMVAVLAALGFPRLEPAKSLPAKQLLDVLKFVLGTVAGVGALFALVMAYRRQRLAEEAHRLAEDAHAHEQHDAAERRVTELYNAAATQLGSDKAPVRLTALYTLERLANDNPRHQQTIVSIICAYLRMPYTPPTAPDPAGHQRQAARRYRARRADTIPEEPVAPILNPHEERQVRLTAQRILHTHLQPSATAHWAGIDLDLSDATLINFTLTGCHLHTATFNKANFKGAAWFDRVKVDDFAGFFQAEVDGDAWFEEAEVGVAGFLGMKISGAARFDKAKVGGDAWFSRAEVGRDARFDGAKIGGAAWFLGMKVGGNAGFLGAQISGDVKFDEAEISGDSLFTGAEIGGVAAFRDVQVGGALGLTSLRVTDQSRPHILPPGWRIEPEEGTAGRVVAEAALGA